VTLLTRAADKLIEFIVPNATVSATTIKLYCGCIDGKKWYKDCQDLNGELKCGGCNVKSSTKC
jgi:hypothetical protein